jgi:hypothetical protein
MSARGRTAGKLSVLSPGFAPGNDLRPAPESTAGKFSVLSAGSPIPVRGLRGALGGRLAAGPAPAGAVPLASTGGTARKESVISQGGTPVFGRALSVSGLAAEGNAGLAVGNAEPAARGKPEPVPR